MTRTHLNTPARYAIRILSGLIAAALMLDWLMSSELALNWSARQLQGLSGLTLGNVHGSLYGPLRIETLSFQTAEQRYDAKDVQIDWSALSLLMRRLELKQLTLQELTVTEIKPGTEPTALPASLHLPLRFSAPAIAIERLAFNYPDAEYVMTRIDLGMESTADDYRLQLRNIATEWGKYQAEMTLNATRPFNAAGQIRLQPGGPYSASGTISGNLSRLTLDARANALGGQADIRATLTPLEVFSLAELNVSARGMNPALFNTAIPAAELAGTMTLVRGKSNALEGNIVLRNRLPGRWNQQRLPFNELAGQFSGTAAQLDLHAIHLNMADAGHFSGTGRIAEQRLQLDLTTKNFNPEGLHGAMRTMRLAGEIHLQSDPDGQQLNARLHDKRVQITLDAQRKDALVALREVTVKSGNGRLTVNGTAALNNSMKFELSGMLERFNPADFGNYPAASLNASVSAGGHLANPPQATLDVILKDSLYRHQPLAGKCRLSLSATRLWNSDIALQLARNRLTARGALGSPGDSLTLQIDADDLSSLDPGLGGKIQATASLEGSLSAPSGKIDARMTDLIWGEHYRLSRLDADGQLKPGAQGKLQIDVALQGLSTPQLRLDQASLNAQGTRLSHTIAVVAKNRDFDAEGRLRGGWREHWSGELQSLLSRGRHKLALASPAKLDIASGHLRLNNAHFDFSGASLNLDELAYDHGQLASRGEFKGLPASYLSEIAQGDKAPDSDLTLCGEWQFSLHDNANGHLALWRERGDLPLADQTALGLSRLTLNMDITNNRLQGQMEAVGTHLGSLSAHAQSRLSVRDGNWGIAGDAPIQADISLAAGSLAWLRILFNKPDSVILDGTLSGHARAGGTFAQPILSGMISGEHLSVALPEQGLNLTDGHFQLDLQGHALHLREFGMRGGAGTLKGMGRLSIEHGSPALSLSLQADKLEVLSRPDRSLALSGTAETLLAGKELGITARLRADRGLFELPRGDEPTASDDVIVTGGTEPPKKKTPPYALKMNLNMDLGEHFTVQGKGLDAQLGGSLNLTTGNGGAPAYRGRIHVVKGRYLAYGQRLEIERGILNFQGPLDNPGLNIVAWRKNQEVEAGVAVSGTAQSPRVKLVSNPTVPDSNKLSWLVLGHDLDAANGQDFSAVQAAAGALLTGSDSISLQQKIAQAAGLEEISVKGSGGTENTLLTLGKRLSSRAYLSYEQGLTGVGALMKINYTLSQRLSVRAQAGLTPAVDLFYTFSFN